MNHSSFYLFACSLFFWGFFCSFFVKALYLILDFEDVQDFLNVSRFSEKTLGSSLKVQIEFCNNISLVGNTKARLGGP